MKESRPGRNVADPAGDGEAGRRLRSPGRAPLPVLATPLASPYQEERQHHEHVESEPGSEGDPRGLEHPDLLSSYGLVTLAPGV
jgi:hypothetical protein